MGNKLCAPWKKGYRDEDHPWAPKKDSHLLRLWAEIFEVREEGGDICWARVSDDVVPVNITCIQDTPETIFQITAYNRHVEKIFDVRLLQPGTRITQASECFVHWKDSRNEQEWGLNFTTPVDARRFRDCCMSPTAHGYARKASSSGSLRLSPPKRVRGRKATSNPTSPVSQPRRAVSSPEELALQDAIEAGFLQPQDGDPMALDPHDPRLNGIDHIATVTRNRQRNIPHAQSVFDQNCLHKHTSATSVYDNVHSLRRGHRHDGRPTSHPHMHKPIAEREIPYNQYVSQNHNSNYATYHSGRSRNTLDEENLRQILYGSQEHMIESGSERGYESSPYEGHYEEVLHSRESYYEEPPHSRDCPYEQQPEPLPEDPHRERKLSKPELRQFSREPTVLRLCERAEDNLDYDNIHVNRSDDLDGIRVDFRDLEPQPQQKPPEEPLYAEPRRGHAKARKASSFDWPAPPSHSPSVNSQVAALQGPEAADVSPGTPTFSAGFDSCTLKRMLRNLPDTTILSPKDKPEFDYDNVTNENTLINAQTVYQQPSSTSSSPIRSAHRREDVTLEKSPVKTLPHRPVCHQQAVSHSQPVSREQAVAQALPRAQTAAPTQSKAQAVSQAQAKAQAVSHTQARAQAVSHTQGNTQAVNQTQANTQAVNQTKANTQALSQALARTQAVSQTQANTQAMDPTQGRTQAVSQTQAKTHAQNNQNNSAEVTTGKPPVPPNKQQAKQAQEAAMDTMYRHNKARDSYPDSGVSGMASETTGSVKSGDSGRSGRSSKTSTLPPGLGLSSLAARSSGGSSGGSSSGRHSDLIRQAGGPGSDTTEVRQLTSSDISESESESSSEAGTSDSSIKTMPSESQASFASKSAAVRKAGWLTVKNWLSHRRRKIELAAKRTWKKYWVCLKGTVLLFYACDDNDTINEDSVPGHMLVIEGGIAQAVPEHPKRENIFALSTAFGDAYLFQAPSQIELENWITGIHSACASSFARQHGKENTLKLLRSEISKLENSIDLDIKMKKMAGLQLTVVTDPRSKQAIEKQIAQWDENLEKLQIEQYRLRCYMASLQGSDLPNPKTLLSYVSKSTKAVLSRVGVFTVTSFHALVCARTPLTTSTIYSKKQKRGLLSTFKADSVTKIRPRSPRSFSPQSGNNQGVYKNAEDHVFVDLSKSTHTVDEDSPQAPPEAFPSGDQLVRVTLPHQQSIVVGLSEKMTVQEVLESACNKRQLNPTDHFIRLKLTGPDNFKIPEKTTLIQSEEYETIEICQKILFQIELSRGDKDRDFGFQVEAELAEDTEQEDELCVFISEVSKMGVAGKKGLLVGDEILVINGKVVADLDMVYVENLLQELDSVCMTIRSCRIERPVHTSALMEHADMYIENMMCPPPPSQSRISDKVIGELIVPAPNWVQSEKSDGEGGDVRHTREVSDMSSEQIDHLLQGAEQVTHFCRLLHCPIPESMSNEENTSSKPLSDSQRIRKVILELIETERQYVKDLNCLIERYLEPLKEETFLSTEDIEQLFGNIQEIVQFQKLFLQSLEEAVELEPNFSLLTEPKKFKDGDLRRILFSLGGSFLYYANHFKLYSSFCASHSKAQKMLNPDHNVPLQEFLRARNPKQQHSSTLESYLIKPIQRILKYPLLLRQLKDLTDPYSDEHHHLSEALRGMEAVAEHINEMQKIYEEYGAIFDELIRQYRDSHPHGKGLDLNVGELQMYGSVNWLNMLDQLGKIKKGTDMITLLFIFKAGVVILTQERLKGKKKPKPPVNRLPSTSDNVEVTRYTTAIPVDQLQVRTTVGDAQERHGIWEMVHCRSEKEGRPEKVYQFASSHEARRDFIRTIHNTIRESVRKMSIPGPKPQVKAGSGPSKAPQPPLDPREQQAPSSHSQHIPYSSKRPETLVTNPMMRGMPKKKGSNHKLSGDMVRHSMDIEDTKVPGLNGQAGADMQSSFRTRSQTLTDLNTIVQDTQSGTECYPSGSQSTISSERGSNSAKLLHSSNSPSNYSSQTLTKDGLGSPIWVPRHNARKSTLAKSPVSNDDKTIQHKVFCGSAYGDYSDIVYDEQRSAVLLSQPNATYIIEHDDTEC